MPDLKKSGGIRTSLEVGFPNGELPEKYLQYRGRATRSIGDVISFPFEDEQFETVMMDTSVVDADTTREAHRVLRPCGRLYFTVPMPTKSHPGVTLADVYSLLRHGFNLVEVQRTPWWAFWKRERFLSICAEKKNWRKLDHPFRPLV